MVDAAVDAEMKAMLLRDLAETGVFEPGELAEKSFWFRLRVRVARLMAPLQ